MPSLADQSFVALQRLIPTVALTGLAHHVAASENPRIAQWLIRQAIEAFNIDLSQAIDEDPAAYPSFNAFFTRALKPDARPLAPAPALLSPVDGRVSQMGPIEDGRIFQAKGLSYSAAELLGSEERAKAYANGTFITIYLAPSDYHRIHMPLTGALQRADYLPGRLLSVNPATVRTAGRVFSRNERMAAHFLRPEDQSPFAMVLVGALFVSGLETVATGVVTPPHGGQPRSWDFSPAMTLDRGAEMGRFNYGSTVILLLQSGWNWEPTLAPGTALRMGQALATPQ